MARDTAAEPPTQPGSRGRIATLRSYRPPKEVVVLYGGVVGFLGLGIVHLRFGAHHAGNTDQVAFEALVLVGFPAATLTVLRRFGRSSRDRDEYRQLLVWGILGTAGTLFVAGLYLLDLYIEGLATERISFFLLVAADVGTPLGLLVGWQSVRVRQSARRAERAEARAEFAEIHRERLTFLNRILRHHVLNGVNVVRGTTWTLRDDVDGDVARSLEIIDRRSEEMAEYVEDVKKAVDTLTTEREPDRIDLTRILHSELESARHTFPNAVFRAELPDGVVALGSELTGVAFENLLENAVTHSDADPPEVWVNVLDGGSVVRVTVADNGPGVPDAYKAAYFERGEHGRKSLGEGLGLYLAETIVSTAGGRIWIEDNDPTGARVVVEFPKPDRTDAGSGDVALALGLYSEPAASR